MCSVQRNSWVVPFGGNAFITAFNGDVLEEEINDCGLQKWTSPDTKISLFFHIQCPGRLLVALRLRVPNNGTSRISFTLSNDSDNLEGREIDICGSHFQLVNCGIYYISVVGYVRIDLQGIRRTDNLFAEVSDVIIVSDDGPVVKPNCIRYVDTPEDFYFGRRGPSVHLQYGLPDNSPDTEYFYNEIFVPKNQDVVGAYFCAMGFTGGYFGIQVNSESERRVLFSVWSEYNTDDPGEIPEDYKVRLIRKGEDVYDGEFGDEGAGAQSYWKYKWQPETKYRFIVQVKPIDAERTMYTAWFNITSSPTTWQLIASFDKPKVSIYFKSPYSFSENFEPEMGYIERHCFFSNQWARDVDGAWNEITHATFTADATARKEQRMDIAGGVGMDADMKRFYLRNCGFFSDMVSPNTPFTRESSGELPPVDVTILP